MMPGARGASKLRPGRCRPRWRSDHGLIRRVDRSQTGALRGSNDLFVRSNAPEPVRCGGRTTYSSGRTPEEGQIFCGTSMLGSSCDGSAYFAAVLDAEGTAAQPPRAGGTVLRGGAALALADELPSHSRIAPVLALVGPAVGGRAPVGAAVVRDRTPAARAGVGEDAVRVPTAGEVGVDGRGRGAGCGGQGALPVGALHRAGRGRSGPGAAAVALAGEGQRFVPGRGQPATAAELHATVRGAVALDGHRCRRGRLRGRSRRRRRAAREQEGGEQRRDHVAVDAWQHAQRMVLRARMCVRSAVPAHRPASPAGRSTVRHLVGQNIAQRG